MSLNYTKLNKEKKLKRHRQKMRKIRIKKKFCTKECKYKKEKTLRHCFYC